MAKKRNLKTALVMSVFLVGMAPAIAAGGVIYVDADASTGGDGTTWGTAYKYLQDALAVAGDGNDIWVAEGTYKPDANSSIPGGTGVRGATFQLINGVAIYGGFAAWETSLEQRDWETNETILSGDLNGDDVGFTNNGENSYHVVIGSNTDANAVLDGFTITAGYGGGMYNSGGGMYNSGGSPMVTNCTFSGNWAGNVGGGIHNRGSGSSPTISNCTFSGNSAEWWGGGVCNEDGNPTLTNCTFTGNSAYDGGGMCNDYSNPTLTNCTFSRNSASYGGGMWNNRASPTVMNCILWGDTAASGPEIYNWASIPTVTYSDIAGGYGGTGNINSDPCFVDADGPDNIIGTEDDNLRLLAGSPCIDAGDNTAVPGGVTTDLDGNPRFVDDPFTVDTGNGTAPIVDMGAYEYQPATIFVDADATGGANNGTSWSDAYLHLQDALADANSNPDINDIRVAEGTYKPDANTANPDGTGDREATFQLLNGVAIYGGFPSGGGNWEDRDPNGYETILSGDLDGNDVQVSDPCDLLTEPTRAENSYHVVTGSGTDATTVLDGFTITAGNANGLDPHGWGGGMCNANESSPTVTNCTFSGNSAYAGGGMYNDSSSPTVTNCTFICNSALADGGGMNNENSSPMVSNCAFIGNSTEDGGGMCNYSSSPTVTNCTFSGNSAISPDVHVLGGGGMCNVEYSSPTVTNCILWGNSSPEPNGPQIALKDNSTISISYCDLQGGQTAIYKVGTNNSVIWGEGNIDADPNFVDPNGPDAIAGTEDDDLRLSAGSPCIDAGDNTAVPPDTADLDGDSDTSERTPLDLDGLDRFVDDPNTSDTGVILPASYPENVDMGAYEWYGGPACGDAEHPYPPGDLSGPDGVRDCYVDFFDFAVFAAHWLEYTGLE